MTSDQKNSGMFSSTLSKNPTAVLLLNLQTSVSHTTDLFLSKKFLHQISTGFILLLFSALYRSFFYVFKSIFFSWHVPKDAYTQSCKSDSGFTERAGERAGVLLVNNWFLNFHAKTHIILIY